MNQFPVLIKHRGSGSPAWAMRLLAENVDDFVRFVPSFRQVTALPGAPTFVIDEGACTMRYGDVIILSHTTQGVIGVCEGSVFASYWELDNADGLIPMPIRAANPEDEVRSTGEIQTNDVEILDLVANAVRGEFRDFENRFTEGQNDYLKKVVEQTKEIVGDDVERRKWIMCWVERNAREENMSVKMKDAVMLEKFLTTGEFIRHWRAGQ